MNLRITIILIALLAYCYAGIAQHDSLTYTTFSKGRSLVALAGEVSSSVSDRFSSIQDNQTISSYTWQIRLAKLVARNYALGLAFDIDKQSSDNLLVLNTEVLSLGPWMSYYFTKDQPGGLFIQTSVVFVNFQEDISLAYSTSPIDESTSGMGIGGSIGFGYNYVVFNRVGLELSMNYKQAWVWGQFDNHIQRTQKHDSFSRVEINFRFGFIILFDKLKKDD